MRRLAIASLLLAACGNDAGGGVARPAGHVAISIAVDDRANRSYGPGQLAWKGGMKFDARTGIAVKDDAWGGPWAKLYDDGPWPGGHEGPGARAGDHVLGATVFMKPPADQAEFYAGVGTVQYGIIDVQYDQPPPVGSGNGWIWPGANGAFVLAVGQTDDVVTPGMTIDPWGDIDFRLALDIHRLEARDPPWDTTSVWIKSSAWGWGNIELLDDGQEGDAARGDGVFTCVLSRWTGPGTDLSHSGPLSCGDQPEFVWVLGPDEYKGSLGVALRGGVEAATRAPGGSWESRPILTLDPDLVVFPNTYVTVPCGGGG